MKYFVLATHGHMASGIKSTLEILMGNADALVSIDCYVDETIAKTAIEELLSKTKEDDQVFICTDIYGGSVTQQLTGFIKPNVYLITGVNLPFVMGLLLECEELDAVKIDSLIEESRQALCRVKMDEIKIEDNFFDEEG